MNTNKTLAVKATSPKHNMHTNFKAFNTAFSFSVRAAGGTGSLSRAGEGGWLGGAAFQRDVGSLTLHRVKALS